LKQSLDFVELHQSLNRCQCINVQIIDLISNVFQNGIVQIKKAQL